MQDLFDKVDVHTMHHKNAGDAEREAANKIAKRVTGLRRTVLECYYNHGPMTGEQASAVTKEWLYSVKPRITELVRIGLMQDSGQRLLNRRKRRETVWEITEEGINFIEARG